MLDDVYSTGLVENKERDEYQQAISNVLSEFETLREISGGLVIDNANLKIETETWKKIAEKLAEHISRRCHYVDAYSNSCDVIEDSCFEDKDCKQCIIDWARKEVNNEK